MRAFIYFVKEGDEANKHQNPTWPKRGRPVPWAAPPQFEIVSTPRNNMAQPGLVPHLVYVIGSNAQKDTPIYSPDYLHF